MSIKKPVTPLFKPNFESIGINLLAAAVKKNQVKLYNNIWQPETRDIYANIIIRRILQEQLEETFFRLVKQRTEKDSINERLKAEDQML